MGSKSSSSTSQSTEQYDQRVGASDNAIALGQGATLNVDATTPEALEFLEKMLDENSDLTVEGLQGSFGLAAAALEFGEETTKRYAEFVTERHEAEDREKAADLLKVLAVGAVAYVAVKGITGQ